MKTQIFNLIILDKSGSMSSIRHFALTGLNETIVSIQKSQEHNPEREEFLTLVSFCSCARDYIYDNKPAPDCHQLKENQYEPCCCTPLYDAIGEACNRMKAVVAGRENASVNVTIITDGYENASKEFNHKAIQALIKDLKEEGWMFAYIGADHDVEKVAFSLNIDNSMAFDKDEEGVKTMFERNRKARDRWAEEVHCCYNLSPSPERVGKLRELKKKLAKGYFQQDKDQDKAEDKA